MTKLLSIVVPVYKVEDYIRKCLNSLMVSEELMEMLDVVVINDGTPDHSADIAREYEKRYPGIFRVYDQENRGHGGAWNHGTELAKGKYLFYLDSDDWVDTDAFCKLLLYLKGCDVDMVLLDRMKYYAEEDRYQSVELVNMTPDVVYDANTYDWLHCGNGSNITYAHNTVYRTSMMQKFLPVFCEHVMYDDVVLQVMPVIAAESFVYTKLNVYRYFIGRAGQSFDPAVRARHADNVTAVLKQVVAFIKQNRQFTPEGSTRRAWADDLYSAFCTHHYFELSNYPVKLAKDRLAKWDAYVQLEFPDISLTKLVKRYRALPFTLYIGYFKMQHFVNRSVRFLKRKLKPKGNASI